jgi:hypothetical protein
VVKLARRLLKSPHRSLDARKCLGPTKRQRETRCRHWPTKDLPWLAQRRRDVLHGMVAYRRDGLRYIDGQRQVDVFLRIPKAESWT